MAEHPIEGQALMLAAAKGSITPEQLPALLDRVQAGLADRAERYDREYELAAQGGDWRAFFVEGGHWADLASEFELTDREADVARRAHAAHLRLAGSSRDRRSEFETALEVREAVVIRRE